MNYSAYNLKIQSDIELPLPLSESDSVVDINILSGRIKKPGKLSRTYDGVWYAHGDDFLYILWNSIASFLIKGGNSITLDLEQATVSPKSSPSAPLLGTVMAVAMHQRGITALHGSGVVIDGKAVIFLGAKGHGKSTMAGYLCGQGHSLISDDVCAVEINDSNVALIHPSFPIIKLWPDTMAKLGFQANEYPRVHSDFEKRQIILESGFHTTFLEIAAIIILEQGVSPTLELLSGHQIIPKLLPHLIINRFPDGQPTHLVEKAYFQLANLTRYVPIYRLSRPRDISLLPELSKLIYEKI